MKHKRLVVKYKNEKFSSKMFGLSPNVPYFEIMDCNEHLATATVRYNIFQLGDIIDAMSKMKSLIINQMPLKEQYKEELDYYKNMYNSLEDN